MSWSPWQNKKMKWEIQTSTASPPSLLPDPPRCEQLQSQASAAMSATMSSHHDRFQPLNPWIKINPSCHKRPLIEYLSTPMRKVPNMQCCRSFNPWPFGSNIGQRASWQISMVGESCSPHGSWQEAERQKGGPKHRIYLWSTRPETHFLQPGPTTWQSIQLWMYVYSVNLLLKLVPLWFNHLSKSHQLTTKPKTQELLGNV